MGLPQTINWATDAEKLGAMWKDLSSEQKEELFVRYMTEYKKVQPGKGNPFHRTRFGIYLGISKGDVVYGTSGKRTK